MRRSAEAPDPDRVRAPGALLALTEIPRALAELAALPLATPILTRALRGDGHPVLVLPGFIASDTSTAVLRRYLSRQGYDAHGWNLGRNLGPRTIGAEGERLVARLAAIHEATGRTVSLVGWSLGGIMARIIAQRAPTTVRQVITLGSPFAGNPKATNVWRVYEYLTGQRIESDAARNQLAEAASPLPVPATAIYSRDDGIVAWHLCREPARALTDAIEVRGSHMGLAVNASVLYAIADRMAQPEGEWRPFDRSGMRSLVYPKGLRR